MKKRQFFILIDEREYLKGELRNYIYIFNSALILKKNFSLLLFYQFHLHDKIIAYILNHSKPNQNFDLTNFLCLTNLELYHIPQTEASDLIGRMIDGGNSEIIRGTAQSLTLSPLALSLDPDEDPSANQVNNTKANTTFPFILYISFVEKNV